jgi:hypothetical protein
MMMKKQHNDDRRFSFLTGKSRQWINDEVDVFEPDSEQEEHDGWSEIRPRRAIARLSDVIREDLRL